MDKASLITKIIKQGGIGVMPTDTIFGLVGSALQEQTVKRIYKVRKRAPQKPMIILISSLRDLTRFGIKIGKTEKEILSQVWPGKVSVILHLDSHLVIPAKAGIQTSNNPRFHRQMPLLISATRVKPGMTAGRYSSNFFKYLHCGTKSLAFRLPDKKSLQKILKVTGPLVAPSANPEDLPPAKTITEAKNYFGDQINFYLPGKTNTAPSTLIEIIDKKIIIRREGAGKIPKKLLDKI